MENHEDDGKFGNMAEIAAKAREHNEWLDRAVTVKDNHIVLGVNYEYSIPLGKVRTHEEILGWTWHLCEKTWITPALLRRFITVACRESGIPRPYP